MTGTRVVNVRAEPYDVLIDRTTPLGNPFRIGHDGDREQVIARYRAWVVHRPDLMVLLPGLRGRVLGCWCAPLPCHGDVLAQLAGATRYLQPGMLCSGYWYADRAGMLPYGGPADPDDREFLDALGVRAGKLARWHALEPGWTWEGPVQVMLYPEWVWGLAADSMAQHAAESGDYGPEDTLPLPRDPRCNDGTHRCPGCGESLPHGTEVCGDSLQPGPGAGKAMARRGGWQER